MRRRAFLAGLIAAQSGGLPDFAGRLDPTGSAGVVAGRIRYTPAATEAIDSYVARYAAATGDLLEAAAANVTLIGPYHPEDVPLLMRDIDWVVVSSRWWENSPLVIQEAFMQRRPVICSGIGGMAEKVTHEVNGLHFHVGDPAAMAAAIERAASEPGLWERLREGIPDILTVDDHIENLARLYRELMERQAAPAPEAVQA